MQFVVDKRYIDHLEKMARKAKKYLCVCACEEGTTVTVELEDKQLRIGCRSKRETTQTTYTLRDIKRCQVYADGCLMLFKDQKMLLLPVTDDEEQEARLVELCGSLEHRLGGLRFVVIDRPDVLADEENGERARVGFSPADSPLAMIVMGILAILMATVFVHMKGDYAPVARGDCTVYAGEFDTYVVDSQEYIELYFADEEMFWVHQACGTQDFLEKLDTVKAGTPMELVVNPQVDYVVEVTADGRELLNFEGAQEAMQREATGFMWIGIVVYAAAVFLIVYGVYTLIREKKARKARSPQIPE